MDTEILSNCEKTNDGLDDFPRIGIDLIKKISFKTSIFLFLAGLFIFSDMFIENFLPKTMVDGLCADSKGTSIQLLVLVIVYILIDLLVRGGIL